MVYTWINENEVDLHEGFDAEHLGDIVCDDGSSRNEMHNTHTRKAGV